MGRKSERIAALEDANALLIATNMGLVKENAELKRILDLSENRPVSRPSLVDQARSEFSERWGRLLDLVKVGG